MCLGCTCPSLSLSLCVCVCVLPFLDDDVSSIGYQDNFLYVNGAFFFFFFFLFCFSHKGSVSVLLLSAVGIERKLAFFLLDPDRSCLVFPFGFYSPNSILTSRSLVSALLSPLQYHFGRRNMF